MSIKLFRRVFILLLISATSFASPKALRVGVIAPMSGDLAVYGTSSVNGMKLALKQIASAPIELIVEDNRSCGATDAVPAAQKLVNIDKVDIIVTVCTGAVQAVLPIAKAHATPLFQITESGPDPEKYMIKMMPDAVGLVDQLVHNYIARYPKMALIGATIQVNTGERGNLTVFKNKFEAAGGKLQFYQEFPPEVLDFRSSIEHMKRSGAMAVTPFLGSAQQMAAFLKQADELKLWKSMDLAGNFFFEFLLKELLPLYPNLAQFKNLESANLAQTTKPQFQADYLKEFGSPAPQFADYAYDAMAIIKRCGVSSSCYRQPFEGVSGRVEFNPVTDRRIGQFSTTKYDAMTHAFVPQK